MYSQTTKPAWYKIAVLTILIFAMIFTYTPKQSDAILLLLFAGAGIPAIVLLVVEAILWCAAGVICGGGGGGGGGDSCYVENSCGVSTTGTIQANGQCSATPASVETTQCTSGVNYCGMFTSYEATCGDTCPSLEAPSDASCIDYPVHLNITPSIVRKGDPIDVSWWLTENYPPQCSLTGPGIPDVWAFTDTQRYGTTTISSVTGPHRYTLTCGNSKVTYDVRILPSLEES